MCEYAQRVYDINELILSQAEETMGYAKEMKIHTFVEKKTSLAISTY